MLEAAVRDLAYAARTLSRSPAFVLTALVTIALGIGATTAIFSVVNAVLLRPLPYAERGRLVLIQGDMVSRNVNDFPMAPGDLPDLLEQGTLFEDVAAVATIRQPLAGDGSAPEQVGVALATTNLLSVLGARTVLGRGLMESDGAPVPPPAPAPGARPGAAPEAPPPPPTIAVLSHGFWQRRYGGDSAVIGRTMRLGGGTAEIVGVLAPEFELLWPPRLQVERRPDVVTALRMDFASASRINVFLNPVARLKPGVTVPQAQAQVDAIVADLRRRFPIKETAGVRWRVEPMHAYLVADVRQGVLALMGAVVFVLLIACANVANLLLVRASLRERELVVRAALGAGRGDLMRQTLAECVLIAGAGAVLGVGLALFGLKLLRATAPAGLPRVDGVALDFAALGFAAAAALAAAALCGLVPALRASRPDAGAALRAAARTGALGGGRALRSSVVVAEVTLAFVLLTGAGLMLRSFAALQAADPGFEPAGLLTFRIQQAGLGTPERRAAFARELRERLEALPGVRGVSAGLPTPLDGLTWNARWGTEAALADPALFQQANVHSVLPGYFAVMRTRIIEGRVFEEADNASGRAVMVIDEVMARKAFPDRSAVGRRLLVRVRGNEPEFIEIIGVVAHQRHNSLAHEGREAIFLADGFFGHGAAGRWVVRAAGDPLELAPAVRAEVTRHAPSVPVAELQPMADYLDRAMAPTRFAMTLLGLFAAVAAVLAAVGLYGVLSTSVRQRTAEIGIRMAFGAQQRGIFRLIIGDGLRLSAAGIGCGLIAAYALTRVMRSLLVGVGPADPATFTAMAAFFLLVAAAACWAPARRAARLDPAAALRDQ